MVIALDILLTILLELPIIALFFKKKKRWTAVIYGLFMILVTWPIVHILKMSTEININYIEIGVIIAEGLALWTLTNCGWKKGFLIAIAINCSSFFIMKTITLDPDMLQNRSNIVIH